MRLLAMLIGVLLIALAAYGYFGAEAGQRSFTAWIPAFVGLPLLACGWWARNEQSRKMAMHVAVAIATLGLLAAGGRGLPQIGVLFRDDPEGNRRAVAIILTMFVLCAVFVGFGVKSFVDARRRG